MKFIISLLLSSLAVFVCAHILPGAHVDGFFVAIVVAVILGLLNILVKPFLVILTIPITIFTLGLFLLVINTILILLADAIVPGFTVDGFWWALFFSILLSIVNGLFGGLSKSNQ
ncbi:MAG: phage holin family protein [Cyclobacteriaceae bacterium]|nr:phage holin family protein [Cyclobacteriaceae bacterium]